MAGMHITGSNNFTFDATLGPESSVGQGNVGTTDGQQPVEIIIEGSTLLTFNDLRVQSSNGACWVAAPKRDSLALIDWLRLNGHFRPVYTRLIGTMTSCCCMRVCSCIHPMRIGRGLTPTRPRKGPYAQSSRRKYAPAACGDAMAMTYLYVFVPHVRSHGWQVFLLRTIAWKLCTSHTVPCAFFRRPHAHMYVLLIQCAYLNVAQTQS